MQKSKIHGVVRSILLQNNSLENIFITQESENEVYEIPMAFQWG